MSDFGAHEMDESLLSGYLDGELDAATRAAVDARLVESSALRAELAAVRTVRDAVRSLPPVDAPSGFWDRVLEAPDNVVDLAAPRRGRAWVSRWRALAGSAAAAAVLGVVFVPRPEPVQPAFGKLTQSHAERASLGNDVVTNLAGAVVPVGLDK
jgi:anti-sigma factor RsiW